ncbi:MAG: hypothetical protein HXY37_07810 [Chloroflexi bacterium]|nr:hypothetical protein [Chloroflexota bacterium]
MLITILDIVAPIVFTIFLIGLGLRLGRLLKALLLRQRFRGVTANFVGAPPPMPLGAALKAVLLGPFAHFHRKSNALWGYGLIAYHIAIITEVTGYTLSALILGGRLLLGQAVPDVARHLEHSHNTSPSNLLAIIFGNGEALQAHFLFGSLAPLFIGVTWVAVGFAVAGNTALLITLLRRRTSAIVSDLDPASRGMRIAGRRPWDRTLVRLLIFCIIWTELFARLELVPGIVFVHAGLGLALFMLFPFTYLFHIVYGFFAVAVATRRRMAGTIA